MRIVVGLLMLCHGSQKVFGFPESNHPTPPLLSWPLGVAGVIELAGGCLVLLGLFTRPAAFILSGQMAVAYFMAHAPRGWLPLQNGGELAVAYCFVFLYLAAAGGGPWSVDHCLKRGPAPPDEKKPPPS
jgi:putative oxidoreductase